MNHHLDLGFYFYRLSVHTLQQQLEKIEVGKSLSLYYHVPELKKFSVRRNHVPLLLLMFHSCQTTVEEGHKQYFVPNP